MMRWLLLCAACLGVYWAPVLIGPADGPTFFVANASWSLLLIGLALRISTSRTALAVAVLEMSAIALNLVCLWQYLTTTGWLYGAYGEVIDAIVIAEIVALAMGAPWNGVYRVVRERWGSDHHWGAAHLRHRLGREACQ